MFAENCRNNYRIGEYCTIDKSLVPFRGRCPFQQFMQNKPAKYGIKVFCLVDSRMFINHKWKYTPEINRKVHTT